MERGGYAQQLLPTAAGVSDQGAILLWLRTAGVHSLFVGIASVISSHRMCHGR